jgi:hypothetical protein
MLGTIFDVGQAGRRTSKLSPDAPIGKSLNFEWSDAPTPLAQTAPLTPAHSRTGRTPLCAGLPFDGYVADVEVWRNLFALPTRPLIALDGRDNALPHLIRHGVCSLKLRPLLIAGSHDMGSDLRFSRSAEVRREVLPRRKKDRKREGLTGLAATRDYAARRATRERANVHSVEPGSRSGRVNSLTFVHKCLGFATRWLLLIANESFGSHDAHEA